VSKCDPPRNDSGSHATLVNPPLRGGAAMFFCESRQQDGRPLLEFA
jgi:hypothetical protein